MTVQEVANRLELEVAAGEDGMDKEISGVYCCDLLSFAMSKAPEGAAWITVMNNVNVIAVASLTDVTCIIMAEGVSPDFAAVEKAAVHAIPILKTGRPAFEIGKLIDNLSV